MINPITNNIQPDISDLTTVVDGVTVCNVCKQPVKELYSTDRGYVCKLDIYKRIFTKKVVEDEDWQQKSPMI